MKLFLENSFSLNNYISISNKIRTYPLFFLYFSTIEHVKNLDENYNELISPIKKNNRHRQTSDMLQDIKYKIICFQPDQVVPTIFIDNHFSKCMYHVFYSSSILLGMNISFTITDNPFVSPVETINGVGGNVVDGGLPILHNFSHSFNFSVINYNNIRMYFSSFLLDNIYSPIEVYLITYLSHHNITILTPAIADNISEIFTSRREITNKHNIDTLLSGFHGFDIHKIIEQQFQSKHTWTVYSLCYYFLTHYSTQLKQQCLHGLFTHYIHSTPIERDPNVIVSIHSVLFG